MRMRERDRMSPSARRELEALDAALAGQRVAPEFAELRDLALALRSERTVPRPEFATELDARAEAGFRRSPRATGAPAWYRRLAGHRRAVPLAVGSAATLFIVAIAVISSGGGGGGDHSGDGVAAPAAREARPAATPGASGAAAGAPVPLSNQRAPATARGRKVERAAALVLSPPPDQVETVADDVIGVTDRAGGFVMSSSVSTGNNAATGATLDLRVPASRLQSVLGDISALAHVRSRTQSSEDITAEFQSPRRRLGDALAERSALLRRLAKAHTANEAASIRARVRLADRRINRARTALRRLDARVGFARVTVSIEAGHGRDATSWTPGDALRDAGSILGVALGILIVGLAVALPVLLVLAALVLVRLAYVRRARERALDAAAGG
jgi:Domain of unknown function (DUF4349)